MQIIYYEQLASSSLKGGGGGLANLVVADYLFSSRAWPENLFPGKPKTSNIYFQSQHIFGKSEKKKPHTHKQKQKQKKWGVVRGFNKGFLCFTYIFCRLLARNIVYLVASMF